MSIKVKATLILVIALAVITGVVFLLLYGINRKDPAKEAVLPSDVAAKAYVEQNHLLQQIQSVKAIRDGGPVFKAVQGTDDSGNTKIVWLIGSDNAIKNEGSALPKDGQPKDTMLAKLRGNGIPTDQIEDMFIAPYDYTSGKLVWFVRLKGVKEHMIWYDFKTGDQIWEGYEDPTAWNLSGG